MKEGEMEEIFLLKRNSPSRVRDGVQELQGKASACQKGFVKIRLSAALGFLGSRAAAIQFCSLQKTFYKTSLTR